VYDPADPNRIEPGKRPRSSMSPTIVLRHGTPFLTLGSPGGSTIITTVLQTLVNRIDLGMTLPRPSPRAGLGLQRAEVTAEPRFIRRWAMFSRGTGHTFGDTAAHRERWPPRSAQPPGSSSSRTDVCSPRQNRSAGAAVTPGWWIRAEPGARRRTLIG
jgi:hypothetical protein